MVSLSPYFVLLPCCHPIVMYVNCWVCTPFVTYFQQKVTCMHHNTHLFDVSLHLKL